MNFKIMMQYQTKNKQETTFHSDWISGKEILLIIDDLDKTGRIKTMEIEDETGLRWTKKELKKLLNKIEDEPDEITIYFDGSYNKDTDEAGIGVVLYYRLGEEIIRHRWNEKIDLIQSNNEAEYIALNFAMERLYDLHMKRKKIVIKGDSQGLLMQLKGEWPCFEENLNRLLDKIEMHVQKLNLIPNYQPIPRGDNKEADQLARQALQGVKIESKHVLDKDIEY
ncbi:reverse transcriptase-like protein [Caldibacillus thermolactis]|jgi:ribonuclease HI|uniref:Reverse transcriptase-like protein n=1 Tax=Pallidibacillus thermolactis TaxID=251051 RepID=A0ABT2WFD3_9BACI|nr:reverse transcriptase-like protein [Pallidibacillus thermolactis]MCU9593641.1 reverse transcriptase-like protein [Pallidibacillus thermolactis]MCU9599910.1 reverse transcriptase-like protein [Pallidibacillus thermolactis subsp. kokeshiiformis]MED1673946.1 reverse transcriptase-like protein [Pallidibacillus thermolactis subsp. kokeshiiformis]